SNRLCGASRAATRDACKTPAPAVLSPDQGSGADGARTPDLLGAIQALSQLSYSPVGTLNLGTQALASNPAPAERHEARRRWWRRRAPKLPLLGSNQDSPDPMPLRLSPPLDRLSVRGLDCAFTFAVTRSGGSHPVSTPSPLGAWLGVAS